MNFDLYASRPIDALSFSSPSFLFVFMPVFFAVYFLSGPRPRNLIILFASLLFYYINAGDIALVLVASILVNHVIAKAIHEATATRGRMLVAVGVVANLAPLLYYKYWTFLQQSAMNLADTVGVPWHTAIAQIALPAGISFFTFQGISYLVDIYRREVAPARTLIDFGMYHALFPQLIAGPIVRYVEISDTVRERPIDADMVQAGAIRFMFGLGKKLILADNAGWISDHVFALPGDQLTTGLAWLGTFAYTLQIYFDFSGYSDMAIGLGRMLGFKFPENFDQPYRSQNITEFWRRWHMTLSRWFRDYVYIPLGGNRLGPARTLLNLLIVFALCGLWHGANYTFLIWGLYHGLLLVVERVLRIRFGFVPSGIVAQAATLLLVMIGWVFFRAPSLTAAWHHLAAMFGAGTSSEALFPVAFYLTADRATFLVIGAIVALFPFERLTVKLPLQRAAAFVVMLCAIAMVSANGFNPFIYYRF